MSDDTILYGINPVRALLESGRPVNQIKIANGKGNNRLQQIVDLARDRGLNIQFVERTALDRMVGQGVHQGVVVRTAPRQGLDWGGLLDAVEDNPHTLIVVLDEVEDPHNLGAIMRSAEAFGAMAVVQTKDRSAPLSAAAIKASAGAAERLDLVKVTNLARALEQLQKANVWVVGLAGDEESVPMGDIDFKGPIALVLGNEGRGLRRLTRKHCDQLAAIPMQSAVESLNVSVAGGVALYEVARQRAE
uniref:23S rRNA (Guanosine-2'-O-)-methyltransferase rlmB n=1 Tax=Magnetococcus massalia (strain MO-1) TaxID=451514 RepID=A0A1S7LNF8_MAGMO|nr:23S rRNA (guanosine-2'-O-)-methyltransferase rlmB [Candidatus Magnetococcus massalia]